MRDAIRARFDENLGRVRRIVGFYDAIGGGPGRRPVEVSDLLRAAVVLLHATFEDALRGLAEWKLPAAPGSAFADVPLAGMKGKTRFDLSDLAAHRGRSVSDVIAESVAGYLDRSSFNNLGEVKALLGKIGIDPAMVDPFARSLVAMMSRRHWIVHRVDRNPAVGRGHHAGQPLSRSIVLRWIGMIERFVGAILART